MNQSNDPAPCHSLNIAVLGQGGREHALVWALSKSPRCADLFAIPGNGGTAELAENVAGIDCTNGESLCGFCRDHQIDLVVIGPEAPLVAGVADVLREAGVLVFGPDAFGAQLEGSKAFSKRFMEENGIATAAYGSFDTKEEALRYVREVGAPIVVKADGLAAGKGVIVAQDIETAEQAVEECFSGAFGSAGNRVVIEECLTGPECSLLAFVCQGQAFCMATAQDHKRAFDGDLGPNTGGMGVYSPVPIVTEDELKTMRSMMEHAAQATARDPFPMDYRGVLYGGFMLTPQGPKVLEYNARFGDPETQVVLTRLDSDLVTIVEAVAQGNPSAISLEWSEKWAVCVVLASEGYPGSYETGKVILGVDDAQQIEGVHIFHAGTTHNSDGELVTAGGRVLNVVALGSTFEEARKNAYDACDCINFEGKQFRSDIGAKAALGRGAWD